MGTDNNMLIRRTADRLQEEGKLPVIEIHILRPTGGEMYNRGFNGRHKTLTVGGVPRWRFSSQSLKHQIRLNYESEMELHTRALPQIVHRELFKNDLPNADYAEELFKLVFNDDTTKKSKSLSLITKQIHSIGKTDVDAYVDAIMTVLADSSGKVKDDAERVTKILKDGADDRVLGKSICLFSRMSTDPALSTVYSAVEMNHPYSVNPAAGDYDDFVAVDDYFSIVGTVLNDDGDNVAVKQSGSAHMQTSDIGSNVYYEYSLISERILFENLCRGRNVENDSVVEAILSETKSLTARYIKDFILTLPGAKQNSNASYPVPAAVYITEGNKVQPLTMDTSFEKAIIGTTSNSVADQAVQRMVDAVRAANEGAFATNQYTGQYWISDLYKDVPDYIKQIKVKDLPAVFGGV